MNVIEARYRPVEVVEHRSAPGDLEPNVPDAPLTVYDEQTGDPVLVVARYPTDELGALRNAFIRYRETARRGGHCDVSRTGGSRTETTSFGFMAAQPLLRRMGCRQCGAAPLAPHDHLTICEAATTLGRLMHEALPRRAALDELRAHSEILPDWMLGDGWWTSGVLNFNSPIAYHRDANNLPCWSAMVTARRHMRGGHLFVPEYDVVLPCRDGDVLYFPGYDLVHGTTTMYPLQPDAYRYTAVYYTVERMRRCGADSLLDSQTRRTAYDTDLIERQRMSGHLT